MGIELRPALETRWLRHDDAPLMCIHWPACRLRADRLLAGTGYCPVHVGRELPPEHCHALATLRKEST